MFRWKSMRAFLQDPTVTEEELKHLILVDGYRKCIKHPNLTITVVQAIIESPLWYVRLVGFCNKKFRKDMFPIAIKDRKSTVRAAAYKGALLIDERDNWGGWISPENLKPLIRVDQRTHGYFSNACMQWFITDTEMSWDTWCRQVEGK